MERHEILGWLLLAEPDTPRNQLFLLCYLDFKTVSPHKPPHKKSGVACNGNERD